MKAFILAAGYGKRLRPLTSKTPKPLIPVNGKPLIIYHMEKLRRAGIRDLVINVHWLAEQIIDFFADGNDLGLDIQFSHESELLDTGGGILNALPLLGNEPFLLVNGDVYTELEFSDLLDHQLRDSLAHLVLVENPTHNVMGDFSFENNDLDTGKLYRSDSKNPYTYAGVALIDPELVSEWPNRGGPFPLLSPLLRASSERRLSGELYSGRWEDVGTVERLNALDRILSEAE